MPFLVALPAQPLALLDLGLGAAALMLEAAVGAPTLPASLRSEARGWRARPAASLTSVAAAPGREFPAGGLCPDSGDVILDVLEVRDAQLLILGVVLGLTAPVDLRFGLLHGVDGHALPCLHDLARLV